MTTIVEIEKLHLRLLDLLESLHSGKAGLIHMTVFLSRILGELPKGQTVSYFMELWPVFHEYLKLPHLIGLEPDILHLIQELIEFRKDSLTIDEYNSLNEKMRQAFLSLALTLGDVSEYLTEIDADQIRESRFLKSPRHRLEGLLNEVTDHRLNHDLKMIRQSWETCCGGITSISTHALLVESESSLFFHPVPAYFYKITADISENRSSSSADQFHFHNHLHKEIRQQESLKTVINVAKSHLLKRGFKNPARASYTFRFSIEEKTAVFEGGSWNASLMALAFCGMLRAYYGKALLQRCNDTVIIGDVATNGHILSVDDEGLKLKIRTAFFSPVSGVIVPKGNEAIVQKILKPLEVKYPARHLGIGFVETTEQLFQLPDLFKSVRFPKWHRYALRIRKEILTRPIPSITAAALLLTGLLLCSRHFFFMDRNPVMYRIHDRFIDILNRDEKVLWSHELAAVIDPKKYFAQTGKRRSIVFDDLNGDGLNEVLIGTLEPENPAASGEVFYYDQNGSLIWQFHAGYQKVFGDELYTGYYRIFSIISADFLNNGQKQILVELAHYPYFPSALILLNQQKEILGEYWHSGRFLCLDSRDINGDGVREIFVGGVNNEGGYGFLAILDPRFMNGSSPQTGNGPYDPKDMPECRHAAYLKFPYSPLRHGTWRDNTAFLNFQDQWFSIDLVNYRFTNGLTGPEACKMFLYRFDYRMNLLSVTANDPFYNVFEEIYKRGFTAEDLIAMKEIMYRNGNAWQNSSFISSPNE